MDKFALFFIASSAQQSRPSIRILTRVPIMITVCCCIHIKGLNCMKAEIESMFCTFTSLWYYYELTSLKRTILNKIAAAV
jgi:hypothetical protein